jgi:hypothetical protein
MVNVDEIIAEIDELEDIFLQCKSFFPALGDQLVGANSFKTAPYYLWKGYDVSIFTEKPITKDFIEKYAKIGNWINENAVIRLFGILFYHKQIGQKYPINKSLPGWEQVRHCCWIRNVITKTRLNYEPETEDNVKLVKELVAYYGLDSGDSEEREIPTPVNKVIRPIFEGCKEYLKAKYKPE